MTFAERFISSANAAGVLDALESARVLIAGFSGGADSTVLLCMLCECFPDKDIRAVHVDHMIRGESAERDARHCREFCRERAVPIEVYRVDVPALAEKKRIGIEQAAREARYEAFADCLANAGDGAFLCTAHNADDNLETVIFNLIRGSGTRGMAGISPRRGNILRPMLSLSSAEIRDFARECGAAFVVDETNADTRYTRNMIRSEVIPLLRRLAPECAKNAAAASALLRRDDDLLCSLAGRAVGSRDRVSVAELCALDDAVLSRALLQMYTAARGERTDLGSVNLADCVSLLRKNKRGEVCLPGGVSMLVADGVVRFAPTVRSRSPLCFERVVLAEGESPSGGEIAFPEAGFSVKLEDSRSADENGASDGGGENIYKKSIKVTIGFDKIKGSITVRERRAGDAIALGGMNRKLKKLVCDKKIPGRETLPVICDGGGVLFVPGIGVRDGAAADEGLRITIRREIL